MKNQGQEPYENVLLRWVQTHVFPYHIELTSWDSGYFALSYILITSSFNNGKALLALCHDYDADFFDYHNSDLVRALCILTNFYQSDAIINCEKGINIMETQLRIPHVLDANDLATGKATKMNIGAKVLILDCLP